MTLLFGNIAFWIILFYFAAPSLPGWATKNWLPTLYAENLDIPMAEAGPISTITIAVSSFIGVILGGLLSDRWVCKDIRGRIYTGAIGLGLTIPALLLLGLGNGFISIVGAGFLFGVGFGMFDANNMPILCQFVSGQISGNGLWYNEYDRSFCRSSCNKLVWKMDGRWQPGIGICYSGRYCIVGFGHAVVLSSSAHG